MTPKSIWNEKQNKPTLIVQDLAAFVPEDVVYESLLRRGVFKWLAVRRDLIRLKDQWRRRVTNSIYRQRLASATAEDVWYERGFRAAVEECRAEIRALCHSDRWRAPDFDSAAEHWLAEYEEMQQEASSQSVCSNEIGAT